MNILWVARDQAYNDNEPVKPKKDCMYMLFTHRPRLSPYGWSPNKGSHIACIRASHWHALTDKSLHLRPGGGPMAVSIQALLVEHKEGNVA
jgi:hypothetical protein